MNEQIVDTKKYFEDIGAWPRDSHSLLGAYVAGFLLSIALTFVAYVTVMQDTMSRATLIAVLIALALAQCAVQLVSFLHLNEQKVSRERMYVLGGAMLVIIILVGGSIWIMAHLNERMMQDPAQMQQYMDDQSGL